MNPAEFNPPPPPADELPDPVLENPIRMAADVHAKRLLQIHRAVAHAGLAGLFVPMLTVALIGLSWGHAASGVSVADLSGRVVALAIAGFAAAIAAAVVLAKPLGGASAGTTGIDRRFVSARMPLVAVFAAACVAVAVPLVAGLFVVNARLGAVEWLLVVAVAGIVGVVYRAIRLDAKLPRLRMAAPVTFAVPLPTPRRADDLERRRHAIATAAAEHRHVQQRADSAFDGNRKPAAIAAMLGPVVALAALLVRGMPEWHAAALYTIVGSGQIVAMLAALGAGIVAWQTAKRPTPAMAVAAGGYSVAVGLQLVWAANAFAWLPSDAAVTTGGLAALIALPFFAGLLVTAWGAWGAHHAARSDRPGPSIPHLLEALRSPEPTVQHHAHAALIRVTGVELPLDATVWRHWVQNALERTGRLPTNSRPPETKTTA